MAPSLSKANSGPEGLVVESYDINHSNQFVISLEDSNLKANGHVFLSCVPDNITLTPSRYALTDKSSTTVGSFIGFDSMESKDRHVISIGKLKNIKFMSIFRFKVWWTTHWVGSNGRDLENETQMLILDKSDSGRPYILLLPLLEGPFRASLQPGNDDNIDICVESGSTKVLAAGFQSVLYVHIGDDPYKLVKDAMKIVKVHLGTFKLLEEKNPPGIVDKFGWCTWDAFYLTVHPQGIWEGVKGLVDGGCPPGLVLIDDGWQSISHDEDPITKEGMNAAVAGEQMPCRLLKFQENYKFRDYVSPKSLANGSTENKGMGAFIKDLKEEFSSVDYVYVWHALCGYWGGLRPNVPGLPDTVVVKPKLSPGLELTMEDLAVDKIVSTGVGLVPPETVEQMYEGLHSHLQNVGIDGVKVDVIHLLEMLCENYGGRVDLAKAYYKALTASVRKHFNGNGVIASMEHCNDFMFLGTEAICLGRVGDDFWCTDPSGDPNGTFWLQGCHMVHCAYNSLWMGNFIHPDWDMFQSTHPCAEFHAASRAISGGPIYVSDSVGKHNFPLLKRLVLPDGSILRCQYYALPTRDCLFEDPLHDGKTMLKIWNLNRFTGVIGVFNCQGGGWCRETRRNKCASQFSHLVTAKTNAKDIEWKNGTNPNSIEGVQVFAMYLFKAKKLLLSKPYENIEIALEPFNFELITVSPVVTLSEKSIQFAPIGLVNMLNTGGAMQSLSYNADSSIEIGVRGEGEMRVFASEKPRACRIDGKEVEFEYEECMVVVEVPWSTTNSSGVSNVEYLF
ncbi:probable galactinol--sucrose galactosyltransferase 5 [Ricinus communis]|uniref:galactinol--sucrose galactosyltransferase n=1 Tax=Ricinus communis TaxID=3988 RepID=B9SF88_RICCO|nr:probable galactinol--sucrose galactosyltransferase 5 [Ricinus communis]EEF37676.1 Stachyose synthase precursor, putative [Ricinus communis]|eukprot:XP_002524657.1 probable galactinol--sucrose galactosyltransferase 5 [Ricinus communis]